MYASDPIGGGLPGTATQFDVFGWDVDLGQAGEWWEMGQDAVDLWQRAYESVGGGSSPWGSAYSNLPYNVCPNTPNFDAVLRWTIEAPQEHIQEVLHYLKDANHGNGPSSRAELSDPQWLPNWVKALMGGKDCKASTFPGAPAFFQASVLQYGGPGEQEAYAAGSPAVGAGLDLDPSNWMLWAGAAAAGFLLLRG